MSDEIEVLPGRYYEAIDFLGKAVRMVSSDDPEAMISEKITENLPPAAAASMPQAP